MQIAEALEWLYSTQFFGIKLGLDATRNLIQTAGLKIPASSELQIVHVAGTNGKGSTCAMIERLAREQGFTTGLFTSPHLVKFNERIRINGEMIDDDILANLISQLKNLTQTWEHPPTFFELALVLALLHFMSSGVNFLILETGMGGRLDATNALRKDIAVLTPIGLDHQQYLGDTLSQIAYEKADIIMECTPVVSARQKDEVAQVIEQVAQKRHALLLWAEADEHTPIPSLMGSHQRDNAALALLTMEALGFSLTPNHVQSVLQQVTWEGRFERVNTPPLVMDGAHNEQAVTTLVQTWKEVFGDRKAALVFAASSDKHLSEMICLLEEIVGEWFLVPCSSPRILPPIEMQSLIARDSTKPVHLCPSLESGLFSASQSEFPVLVSGSLFLVGDLKAYLSSEHKHITVQ